MDKRRTDGQTGPPDGLPDHRTPHLPGAARTRAAQPVVGRLCRAGAEECQGRTAAGTVYAAGYQGAHTGSHAAGDKTGTATGPDLLTARRPVPHSPIGRRWDGLKPGGILTYS